MLNIRFTLNFREVCILQKNIDSLRESVSRFCELTKTAENKTRRNDAEQVLLLLEIHALCSNEGKVSSLLIYLYTVCKIPEMISFQVEQCGKYFAC
jgi:hypothetical protein